MTAPATYSEKQLADYIHQELAGLTGLIGLAPGSDDPGSYSEAVNETLLAYGVSDIAQAQDVRRLRALARVQAWRLAVNQLAVLYSFSADGGRYERGELYNMAQSVLKQATLEALAYDPAYTVRVTRARPVNDPYRYTPQDESSL